jgi:polyisoprenoid-binding protein YceI
MKMMKTFKIYTLLISALIFTAFGTQAQDYYKLQPANSKLLVEGTSTVHDWQVESNDFSAETVIKMNGDNIAQVSHVEFTSPAESLKSGKKLMDSKIQEALKTKNHPDIKFSLKGEKIISGDKATIPGILTIAGKTKEINVTVDFDAQNPQKFNVSGQVPLKMSEFNVDPPTAMMGTIKTGDEVLVKFDLEFQRSSETFSRNR